MTHTSSYSQRKSRPFKGRRDNRPGKGGYSGRSFNSAGSNGGGRRFGNRNSRPASRTARFGGRNRGGQAIDISKFINRTPMAASIEAYAAVHTFADFGIDERLKKILFGWGYIPTAIQDQAIPHVLAGRDVVGIANTGTGKTLAFLVPLLNKALHDKNEKTLVIVPTRELAQQIGQEFERLTKGMNMFSVTCVGGISINRQIAGLRRRHQFVFGTPGRLKDLSNRKSLDLAEFQTVVLDEADRMLDMGFVEEMRFLLSRMSPERHTLFFSATMPSAAQNLVKEFLNDPVTVSVRTGDTAQLVDQDIIRLKAGEEKMDVLCTLLGTEACRKVLVFGKTKHGVEKLAKTLARRGVRADSIHGNKTQPKRERVLAAFKKNIISVLVATDVAARGIDVPDISHVINFDLPATYEDYIHRIGRTGRSNKHGKALTFVE